MPSPTPRELVQVGTYLRADQAQERALVVLALGSPYWILEDEGLFCLYVEGKDAGDATAELEKFETERDAEREHARAALRNAPPPGSLRSANPFSLYVFVWTMCLFFALQRHQGARWTDLGLADSKAILHGQWWRTLTSLTLHADLGHFFANLTTGLVFAWALLPLLGSGWTWLGLLLSGAVGNTLNALVHQGGSHLSLGASTAVFGGIGLLVGCQTVAAIQRLHGHHNRSLRIREVALPSAAGLALLAYLGIGDGTDRVDVLAHVFGMVCGGATGVALAWTHLPERTTPGIQKALAVTALLLPVLAWVLAAVR